MRAEILTVGTELLLGYTVNTNAAYLSQRLAQCGVDCYRHQTVGDNAARLAEALRDASRRADLLLITGGLGPTVDDITVRTVAQAFHQPLRYDARLARAIAGQFRNRRLRMPAVNRRQAWVPRDAEILPNPLGTAPGLYLRLPADASVADRACCHCFLLPGVPSEMQAITEGSILPRLRRWQRGGTIVSRTLHVVGAPESAVDQRVARWLRLRPPVTVGIYASAGQVALRITAKAASPTAARRLIRPVERALRRGLGPLCFGADDDTLERVVGQLLVRRRATLAVAESCTGGLVMHRLTEIAGSSRYLRGGIVAYDNRVKEHVLRVSPVLLKRHGAVSRPTALAMARGARERLHATFGLSVTGIAGPSGGTVWKPVGLVYIACAGPRGTRCKTYRLIGTRRLIKWQASQAALDLLRRQLLKQLA